MSKRTPENDLVTPSESWAENPVVVEKMIGLDKGNMDVFRLRFNFPEGPTPTLVVYRFRPDASYYNAYFSASWEAGMLSTQVFLDLLKQIPFEPIVEAQETPQFRSVSNMTDVAYEQAWREGVFVYTEAETYWQSLAASMANWDQFSDVQLQAVLGPVVVEQLRVNSELGDFTFSLPTEAGADEDDDYHAVLSSYNQADSVAKFFASTVGLNDRELAVLKQQLEDVFNVYPLVTSPSQESTSLR